MIAETIGRNQRSRRFFFIANLKPSINEGIRASSNLDLYILAGMIYKLPTRTHNIYFCPDGLPY